MPSNNLLPAIQSSGYVQSEIESSEYLNHAPYTEAQLELEVLFNKNQRMKRIRGEFDIPKLQELWATTPARVPMPYEFVLDLLVQMCIHKSTTASVLIGILHKHFMYDNMHDIDKLLVDNMPEEETQIAMQRCAEALEVAIEVDYVDYDCEKEKFTQVFQLTAETTKDLHRYQYPLPMIIQPQTITHNRENGYLDTVRAGSLVVLKGSKAGHFYEHNDVCLDHLNRVNRVPLKLNHNVASLIDNEWKDLDRKRTTETYQEYQKRCRAFEKYTHTLKV